MECRLKAGEPARVEEYLQRFPELGSNPDTVLELLCSEYELRQGVEKYPQRLVNVRLDRRMDVLGAEPVRAAVTAAEAELAGQGRVLLRASGTEPLIRVMVEGRDEEQVRRLADQIADSVRGLLGRSE